jgi:hypothetical protein
MDFSFFLTDNKSGYKTNVKWFSKNYPEEYSKIIKYSNKCGLDLNFKEQIWFYFHKIKERPKCLTCGDEVKFRNRFDKPYGDFCTLQCANKNKTELVKRQKKTFQKKYGVNFYPQHKDFVKKQKNTKKTKYGNENYNNVEKSKKTRKKKYGSSNYVNHEKYKETCLIKYGTTNYSKSNNYKNKIIDNFKKLYPDVNILNIKKGCVNILCTECNKEYEITKQLLYERYKRNYVVCTECNPVGFSNRSGYEDEICNFLKELNIMFITNKKIPNKRGEIDIFIPSHNIGIEFNGLYWHNELFKTNDYHLNKTIDCENSNIDLIHIFEDEWIYNKDIIKSVIKNKLNLLKNKIFGRNCVIKEITTKESKKFLEENHIQGNVNSKVRIGLFNKEKLVSVMTFSKGRVLMGGKDYEWELNRFSNLIDTNVIGAASKLLKYFITNYKPEKIVSYSDIRLFKGGMYDKLGFVKISQSKPNYWYVLNDIRKHRFGYRKSILIKEGFDKNKTEREIMFERKIYRIYDCGNIRWELNID